MSYLRLLFFILLLISLPLNAAKKQNDYQVNLSLSKESVWQREQVTLTLEIITTDTFARLDSDDYQQNGFTIIPLEQEGVEENGKLRLSKKWIIFPFLAGEQIIKLPRIRYRPNSGRPVSLDLPQKILSVLKLPVYVAPTMPVGNIELESEWANGGVVFTDTLYNWNIKVRTLEVAPQTQPAITRQLRSSNSLQILPFKKKRITKENMGDSIPKVVKTGGGVFNNISYQVPIKAISLGVLELPDIAIQYFEPSSGRLKVVSIKQPTVFVVNKWLIAAVVLLLLLVLAIALFKLTLALKGAIEKQRLKKLALNSLSNSKSYQQIRAALTQYAVANKWEANTTLDQFVQYCEKGKYDVLGINDQLNKLRSYEFSTSSESKQDLKLLRETLYFFLK